MKWGASQQNNKLVRVWDTVLPRWHWSWNPVKAASNLVLAASTVFVVFVLALVFLAYACQELPVEIVKGLYYTQILGN